MTIATFSDRTATFPQTAATNAAGTAIIEAQHVGKAYRAKRGKELTVLRDISFTLHEGEIVAILGRSGAGKSTFLRILAGLVPASSGTVTYRGTDITGPNPGVGLVFQTFALMPWLTVQANVELGLEARGVPREERRRAALQAIDAIGLDGFENAYPKELSGGMRQRVGIARALVVQPDALFMDEPFSALDVLTAENLRNEVLKMWSDDQRSIKSVLIVTHNIEEAVQMADRVVVLGSHPGYLIADVPVTLPRPRDRHSAQFEDMVDTLYAILTGQSRDGGPADTADERTAAGDGVVHGTSDGAANQTAAANQAPARASNADHQASSDMLPNATPGGLAGLVEIVYNHAQGIDLADLAAELSFEVDDLFPLIDAGTMLGLLTVENGHVTLTELGRQWRQADILTSKTMFAAMLQDKAPLVRIIDRAVRHSEHGRLRGELIVDLLRARHTDAEAERQFNIAMTWGRYGELFDYDADDDIITVDAANPANAIRPAGEASETD